MYILRSSATYYWNQTKPVLVRLDECGSSYGQIATRFRVLDSFFFANRYRSEVPGWRLRIPVLSLGIGSVARRRYKQLVQFSFNLCLIHSALDLPMYVFITVHVQRVGVCWCVCAIGVAIFIKRIYICVSSHLFLQRICVCVSFVSAFGLIIFLTRYRRELLCLLS